jgi:hypothetical protein
MEFKEYQDKAVATAIYGKGSVIIYPALGLGNENVIQGSGDKR